MKIVHRSLASRFLNRPLALLPAQAGLILEMLEGSQPVLEASFATATQSDSYRPYDLVGGVAVVAVRGVLVHGSSWCFWGEQTQYGRIRAAMAQALGDDGVLAIAMHIDSPGGDVTGCFDLVDAIFKMRGSKPIWAIVDEAAYSAGYALASAADRILVPRSGGVGSIGIIAQHTSVAGMLERAGIEVTTITFGDRKADGNPAVSLSDAATARIQADVDAMGELFCETVARNRGLKASAVRATQAGTYLGAAGVAAGLADEVASADEAFLDLLSQIA